MSLFGGHINVYTKVDDWARRVALQRLREQVAKEGYDEKIGARPMQRLIQEKVKKQLAEDLLFGDLSSSGGTVRIYIEDDDLKLEVASKELAKI